MTHPIYLNKTYRQHEMSVRPEYRELMLLHIDYLRNHPKTRTLSVDPQQRNLDLYDWFRFLNNIKYPTELHWVILLVNDIPSQLELDMTVTEILAPSAEAIEEIIATSGIV